jgi:NAD(P)-dependent dehydrogenase (short-subunit alcohol dehydrogenase family)
MMFASGRKLSNRGSAMNLELNEQVAVIVGAARGIGLAIAHAFVREGARVALLDRDPAVTEAARSLETQTVLGVWVDATDYAAMRAARASVAENLGPPEHVVYAAAVGSGKFGFPYWNLEPDDWERVWRVNVQGAVNMAHAFGPAMAERRRGTMLFIASVAGQIGSQTDPPYSASKAAVINFAQCAARDLAPYGVRVNTLCPGMIKTSLNQSVYEAWARQQARPDVPDYETWAAEKIARVVPLNRWQDPEDIANAAVFLASPRARNMTGQTINVDGGFVMHW